MSSFSSYTYTIYRGLFIQLPRNPGPRPELLRNRGVLWVSTANGRIQGCDWGVRDEHEFQRLMQREGWVDVNAWTDSEVEATQKSNGSVDTGVRVKIVTAHEERNEFFFPGFIDTHIHAPQFSNIGLFGSSTLLDWLQKYTFPVEASFGPSPDERRNGRSKTRPEDAPLHAQCIYDQVIKRTLSHGTTCASYFATNHIAATNALATLCHSRGQRAFIGRVCMDNPDFCAPYYRDLSPEDSVDATRTTIEYIHSLDPKGNLVKPIITPRFAPTCSLPALQALGTLAAEYQPPLHIQTHISENMNEVVLVKELFPELSSYAAVYDEYNLLTPRTILAHGVHLSADERSLIRQRDTKISHCPASNSALGSGICPVRTLLDEGLTVGLGTDVSGGYSPSILEAVRQACLVSRLLGHTAVFDSSAVSDAQAKDDGSALGREKLSVEECLYLATRGGAAVVDMTDDIGGFDVNMLWDAQLIELGSVADQNHSPLDSQMKVNGVCGGSTKSVTVGNVELFGKETWDEKIHKWVWSGDDRNVKAVWVGGRLVHSRD